LATSFSRLYNKSISAIGNLFKPVYCVSIRNYFQLNGKKKKRNNKEFVDFFSTVIVSKYIKPHFRLKLRPFWRGPKGSHFSRFPQRGANICESYTRSGHLSNSHLLAILTKQISMPAKQIGHYVTRVFTDLECITKDALHIYR